MQKLSLCISFVITFWSLLAASALDYASFALPAKIESLGNAAAAREDGLGGIYINPAALSKLKNLELLISTGRIFDDYTRYTFALGSRLQDGLTTVGLTLTTAAISGLQRVEKIDGRPQVLYEDSSYHTALLLSLARGWTEKLHLGLNLKYYNYILFDASASGLGLDAGLQYAWRPDFSLGLGLRNINNTRLNWSTGSSDTLDREIQAGFVYKFKLFYWPAVFSLDNIYSSEKTRASYGAEFWLWPETLALRAGLAETPNLGLGFNLHGFSLDYAYTEHADLGFAHKFSLGWTH